MTKPLFTFTNHRAVCLGCGDTFRASVEAINDERELSGYTGTDAEIAGSFDYCLECCWGVVFPGEKDTTAVSMTKNGEVDTDAVYRALTQRTPPNLCAVCGGAMNSDNSGEHCLAALYAEEAAHLFWTTVAENAYSDDRRVTTGDLPPDADAAISTAMHRAVRAWLDSNTPSGEAGR